MTEFLDLLEAYHHWCVKGDSTRLKDCGPWLSTLTRVPTDEAGWHCLGTDAIDWLVPLPAAWEPNWPILSPREMTLTVEALDYLETRRSGAIAAALSLAHESPSPESPWFESVPVNWSLGDVLACVEREVARREAAYPGAVGQGRLTTEQARLELGQMKAAAMILRSMQDKGQDARQGTLF